MVLLLLFISPSSLFPKSSHPSRLSSGTYNPLSKKTFASWLCPEPWAGLCPALFPTPLQISKANGTSFILPSLCLLKRRPSSWLQRPDMATDCCSESVSVNPKMNECQLRPALDSSPLPSISGGCDGCQEDEGPWSFVTSEVTGPGNFLFFFFFLNFLNKTQGYSNLWVHRLTWQNLTG